MTDPENGPAKRADDEDSTGHGGADSPPECHRRDCSRRATFLVLERYQEETGHGPVEAEAFLCREHTDQESPANLDGSYGEYVFRVEPLPETAAVEDA